MNSLSTHHPDQVLHKTPLKAPSFCIPHSLPRGNHYLNFELIIHLLFFFFEELLI